MAKQINPLTSQLKDIKPPVKIDDWSIYAYWGIIIVSIIVLGFALYYLVKTILKMRRTNKRKEYLEALKRIDWSNSKNAAYEATRLGRLILPEDEKNRLHELYAQMVHELEKYKYKKEVDKVDQKSRSQFDLFVKACDESI